MNSSGRENRQICGGKSQTIHDKTEGGLLTFGTGTVKKILTIMNHDFPYDCWFISPPIINHEQLDLPLPIILCSINRQRPMAHCQENPRPRIRHLPRSLDLRESSVPQQFKLEEVYPRRSDMGMGHKMSQPTIQRLGRSHANKRRLFIFSHIIPVSLRRKKRKADRPSQSQLGAVKPMLGTSCDHVGLMLGYNWTQIWSMSAPPPHLPYFAKVCSGPLIFSRLPTRLRHPCWFGTA